MYVCERVESLTEGIEEALMDLYYTHVHPSYPIAEDKSTFSERCRSRTVRMSLRTVMFCHALQFWHLIEADEQLEKPDELAMRVFAFDAISIETRLPSLDSVKAILLYLQLPSMIIREPNRPGVWELTALVVALSQDIGLHIEPTGWNIPLGERRTRRILWWAVYMQDKWLSHWLGRPSHISSTGWDINPLVIEDFCADGDLLDVKLLASYQAFVAHAELAVILTDILDTFYSIRRCFSRLEYGEVYADASTMRRRSQEWRSRLALDLKAATPICKSSRANSMLKN